jgi:hypothetical protein
MEKNDRTNGTENSPGTLKRFESAVDLRPIEDRNEYEERLNALPANQKELAQESTRLADLCHYFSAEKIDIPPHLVERVSSLGTLAIPERIQALKEVNRALMEYINDVGQDPGIRQ